MTVILKGTIDPQAPFDHKESVEIINGHLSSLWPNDYYAKIRKRLKAWLWTLQWVDLSDPMIDLQLELMDEAWAAQRCQANFRRLSWKPTPHPHTPWFTIWGTLTGRSFCSRNLIHVLYSPEYRVGIIQRVIRLAPHETTRKVYKRLVRRRAIRA